MRIKSQYVPLVFLLLAGLFFFGAVWFTPAKRSEQDDQAKAAQYPQTRHLHYRFTVQNRVPRRVEQARLQACLPVWQGAWQWTPDAGHVSGIDAGMKASHRIVREAANNQCLWLDLAQLSPGQRLTLDYEVDIRLARSPNSANGDREQRKEQAPALDALLESLREQWQAKRADTSDGDAMASITASRIGPVFRALSQAGAEVRILLALPLRDAAEQAAPDKKTDERSDKAVRYGAGDFRLYLQAGRGGRWQDLDLATLTLAPPVKKLVWRVLGGLPDTRHVERPYRLLFSDSVLQPVDESVQIVLTEANE